MSSRQPVCCFASVLKFLTVSTFFLSAADAAEKPDTSVSLLRGIIERYSTDLDALERRYDLPMSTERVERMRQFFEELAKKIGGIDFAALDADDRIDYLLLQNDLRARARELDHEK